MPGEADADYATWKGLIQQEASEMGEQAILVGHSVGASVLIRMFVEDEPKPSVAGLFLIASPFWHDDEFWHWDEARLPEDAARRFPDQVPLYLYHGEADEVVPLSHLEMLASLFPGARVGRLPGRDHQLNDDMSEVSRDIRDLGLSNGR